MGAVGEIDARQAWQPNGGEPVHGSDSPVARVSNALATAVHMSGVEKTARQIGLCRFPRHHEENGGLGSATPGQDNTRPPCPLVWTMAINKSIDKTAISPTHAATGPSKTPRLCARE